MPPQDEYIKSSKIEKLNKKIQDRDVSKKPVQAIVRLRRSQTARKGGSRVYNVVMHFTKLLPPKINECPSKKGTISKKKLHLPTIDFQGRTVSYY